MKKLKNKLLLLFIFLCGFVNVAEANFFDCETDLNKCIQLADSGNAEKQFDLASLYEGGHAVEKDLKKSFEWYLKSANLDYITAQFKVGLFYINGWGVKKDESKAAFWYQKAAQKGSIKAQKKPS